MVDVGAITAILSFQSLCQCSGTFSDGGPFLPEPSIVDGTPVKFAVIGCADVARRKMLPAMRNCKAVELVGVASRNQNKSNAFADEFGCKAYPSYEAVLNDTMVMAVYIPLPTALNSFWSIRALTAGKHVLVEKTAAGNVAAATEMVACAGTNRRLLMENFVFLHHRRTKQVITLLAQGEIGALKHFSCCFGFNTLQPRDIRFNPNLGGGALLDIGTYGVRAARLYLGEDLQLLGSDLRYDTTSGVDVAGMASWRNAAGVTAQISFGFDREYRCRYDFWGHRGSIQVDRCFGCPPDLDTAIELSRDQKLQILSTGRDDQFVRMLEHFCTCLKQAAYQPSLDDMMRQARVLEEIRKANPWRV